MRCLINGHFALRREHKGHPPSGCRTGERWVAQSIRYTGRLSMGMKTKEGTGTVGV